MTDSPHVNLHPQKYPLLQTKRISTMNKTNIVSSLNKEILTLIALLVFNGCASTNKNPFEKFPELKGAKLKAISVPDRIEGNTFIEAHTIYVIETPSVWKGRD